MLLLFNEEPPCRDAYDWFSNEPKTSGHVTISGDKKDDDKTEKEATEKDKKPKPDDIDA